MEEPRDLGPVPHLMHSFLPRHELVLLEGASRSDRVSDFDRREGAQFSPGVDRAGDAYASSELSQVDSREATYACRAPARFIPSLAGALTIPTYGRRPDQITDLLRGARRASAIEAEAPPAIALPASPGGPWRGPTEGDWLRRIRRGAGFAPDVPAWLGPDQRAPLEAEPSHPGGVADPPTSDG